MEDYTIKSHWLKRHICKVIGHDTDNDINDSGYPICERCGSHGYYNEGEWHLSWFNPVWRIRVHLIRLRDRFRQWRWNHRDRSKDSDIPF